MGDEGRIRPRAYLAALAGLWLSAQWIFHGEIVRYSFVTLAAPFVHAVFILLALTIVNMALQPRLRRCTLTPKELLVVYAVVSVGSAVMSCDMQSILVTMLPYPAYFLDTPEKWSALISGAVPEQLLVTDRQAVELFYRGNSTVLRMEILAAWARPLALWSGFIIVLLLTMQSAAVLLRKAWVENERLSFPIVALPLALACEPRTLFSNRMLWLGLAAAGSITLLNGISYLYPAIPSIPIKRQPLALVSSGPLAGPFTVTVAFYFFAITLGFLMPVQLGMAIWLFFVLYRIELATVQLLGLPPESRAPYAESQAFGAYVGVLVASLWRLGGSLRSIWRAAWTPGQWRDPEAAEYRRAIIGLAVGATAIAVFLAVHGMRPFWAVVYVTVFLGLAVMISRVRAELGFPVHDMHAMGPAPALIRLLGAQSFDRSTLGMFAMTHWLHRAYRGHPMPHQLEALKLAGTEYQDRRSMNAAIAVGAVGAVLIGFGVFLDGFYRVGAGSGKMNQWAVGYAREAFGQNLPAWLQSPARVLPGERYAALFGLAFALVLGALRNMAPSLPVHPLAYAVANSWGVANLWLPIMIGNLAKVAVLKAGGLRAFRNAVPFFYGLMLGEFAVGGSWTLLGMALNTPTYEFWP